MKKNQLFALSCLAVMMTMSACAESNIKAPLEETSCRADSECQAVDPEGTCNLITGLCVLGTCGNARIDEGEACDGAVAADASCPSGMVGTVSCSSACQLDVSKCQKAEECLYPEPKCDGSVWHYCEGQANHSITCGSGQYIAKPKCEDLMGCVIDTDCEDGARSCNGNQPQICESGVWQKYGSVCEFGCNNTTGECNTEEVSCSAGSTQCNGSRVQTCNGSTWIDGDDCSYGCDTGICKNEEGVCEEGKKLCNGSVPMICSDNAWQILDACTYGCSEGACKEQNRVCEEGKKQCNGSIVQTCTDNAWVSGDTCQFGCTEGSCNGQYSVCEEGKKQCNGSIVQTCAGNTWVNGESCTYGCKAGGTCADESDECKDEARQCNGSTPMVCEEGKWKSEAECKYGCSGGVCNNEMAVCNSGQK